MARNILHGTVNNDYLGPDGTKTLEALSWRRSHELLAWRTKPDEETVASNICRDFGADSTPRANRTSKLVTCLVLDTHYRSAFKVRVCCFSLHQKLQHMQIFRTAISFKYPVRRLAITARMSKMSLFLSWNCRQVMLTSYHSVLLLFWLSTMLTVYGHEAQNEAQTYTVGLSLGHQYL